MKKRKIIILVISVLLVAALTITGVSYWTSAGRHTCNVYPLSDLATTEYYGDDKSMYGEVRADQVQTVYLSDTQQVTEIYVSEGQTVQPGDKLMAYDTTLSALEVNRKELDIKQTTEELTAAKKEYNTLAGSKVYKVAAGQEQAKLIPLLSRSSETYQLSLLTNEGAEPEHSEVDDNGVVQTYARKSGSGTHEDPYLYVCANGIPFHDNFLREIGILPSDGSTPGAADTANPVYVVFGISEGNALTGKILQAGGMCFSRSGGNVSFIVFDASDYIGRAFGAEKPETKCDHSYQATVQDPTCTEKGVITFTCKKCNDTYTMDLPALGHSYVNGKCTRCEAVDPNYKAPVTTCEHTYQAKTTAATCTAKGVTKYTCSKCGDVYTKDIPALGHNYVNGKCTRCGATDPDYTTPTPTPNPGPSYAEIQAQKAELQQKIKDLDLSLRMAQVELKRMKQELSDGVVYADMAGTISSVLDADTAFQTGDPLIKLAGGGGYYIQGSVSELELDTVYSGQHVTITSWENGSQYDGVVDHVSDSPDSGMYGYNGGNSNVSYYPVTITVSGDADFRQYEGVEIRLPQEEVVTDSLYLDQPFILQESGHSYVYVAGADGLLEKREVVTGITIWGSTIQILSGLTVDESIAFPYGKDAVEGAQTKLSTLEELYSY